MSDKDLDFSGFDFGDVSGEEFSLESILAEYKGDAFIAGDKKTPEDVLEAVTNKIMREARGEEDSASTPVNTDLPKSTLKEQPLNNDFFADIREPFGVEDSAQNEANDSYAEPEKVFAEKPQKTEKEEYEDVLKLFTDSAADTVDMSYASKDADSAFVDEISKVVEEETEKEAAANRFAAKFAKKAAKKDRISREYDSYDEEEEYDDFADEEEPIEEPSLGEAAAKAGRGIKSMTLRSAIAFVICVFMAIFTYRFDAGKSVPFGIGENGALLTGILLIMQIVVMMLSVDILVTGVKNLLKATFGGETLVLISNVCSVLYAMSSLTGDGAISALPFCTISAITLMFALRGKRAYEIAVAATLRTAVSAANPYSVVLDAKSIEDRAVLKKTTVTTDGFYSNLRQEDISEFSYNLFAPIIIVICLVLSVLIRFIIKAEVSFLYVLSALTAVSASFSVMLTFALPFKRVAKKAKRSGAAIAGWGGAVNVAVADSALITDEDIFPMGTMSINGIKVFESVPQSKAIIYTSSMIIASGSGASYVFSELLKSQKYPIESVDEFACYQGGGISGIIRGERVMVGSAAFMNLMGIRVPDSVNTKDAMFTVINDELSSVFQLNYIPANSVQKAIVAIMKTKVTMLFAVRDFNVTPSMVQRKFKVNMSNFEDLSVEDCYRASEEDAENMPQVSAILSRGGLAPMADAVVMGWQLKLVSTLATAVSILTSILGVFFIAFMCMKSGVAPASSVLTFMLLVHLVVLLISHLTKRK